MSLSFYIQSFNFSPTVPPYLSGCTSNCKILVQLLHSVINMSLDWLCGFLLMTVVELNASADYFLSDFIKCCPLLWNAPKQPNHQWVFLMLVKELRCSSGTIIKPYLLLFLCVCLTPIAVVINTDVATTLTTSTLLSLPSAFSPPPPLSHLPASLSSRQVSVIRLWRWGGGGELRGFCF